MSGTPQELNSSCRDAQSRDCAAGERRTTLGADEQGLSAKGRGDAEKEEGNELKSRTVGIMGNLSLAESVLLNSWSLN